MYRIFCGIVPSLVLAVCLTTLSPTPAAAAVADSEESISLDFRDVELTELIETMAELTGRNFIYDETVRGKVTIISPGGMSLDEAYQLFLTVLNVKGYTVVPSGKANKIVQIKNAARDNLPVVGAGDRSAAYVTRMVRLTYGNATELAGLLASLIPKTGSIVAYAPSNTLVITDSGSNIDRLVKIIEVLDVPSGPDQMEIFTLRHADAEEVARVVNSVLGGTGAVSRRARAGQNIKVAGQTGGGRAIGFKRTNSLIVLADRERMEMVRGLIARLDAEPLQERSNINVYYLENADAETLAKTLNEILTGMRATATSTPAKPGQKAPATRGPVSITADKPTNALLINASPEDYALLKGIIRQLDVRRKQVFVEALILELSMDATREVGVALQGAVDIHGHSAVFGTSNLNSTSTGLTSLAPDPNVGNGQLPSLLSQTINGLLLGGLFSPITTKGPDGSLITIPAFSALIQLSEKTSDVNILSAPRLLTSDNEEAEIIVGSNVPVITSRLTDTGGTGLAQSVAVERQDVALTLRFTPQITEGDLVRLNVFQEITDIADNSVGNINEVGPTFTKRQLRNTVLARNGQTIVLGGLIGTNIKSTESKVPLLGDIPLLGRLFRSSGTTEQKTNLLVFITPHIIRDSADLAEITRKSRLTGSSMQTEALRRSIPPDSLMTELPPPAEDENP
ncbi:general secretion pathway protein D [Geothermobacter ehrlichii]|uniref:General secretion pathway protein D n=1 Tax=Geothermobacter ehrlichii TaxID=213224 RepID=A0A5D3WJ96_9BACT|nr:type II secretion system secretin GspD [Geothermobacter ehrlichii]TYO97565.1 general secretion pathway protein D [Geothermobacter ehrlichii]